MTERRHSTHARGNDNTQRDTPAWVDLWWLTPNATPNDVHAITSTARATRSRVVAHPATLERMARTVSPFGPISRSLDLTAMVLGVDVTPDRARPEGLVTTHAE